MPCISGDFGKLLSAGGGEVPVQIFSSHCIEVDNKHYSANYVNSKDESLHELEQAVSASTPCSSAIIQYSGQSLYGLGYKYKSGTAEFITESRCWPGYLRSTLSHPHYRDEFANMSSHAEIIDVAEVVHVFHPHMRVFGHFLIEGTYKLLLLNELQKYCDLPLYLSEDSPDFILKYVDVLVPAAKKIICPKNKSVRAGVVYDFLFHPNYIWPQGLVNLFRELAGKFRKNPVDRKIFISRKNLSSQTGARKMVNSSDVTDMMLKYGFEVVDPTRLTIENQIKLFAESRVVVGEYGSGMHNTIFCNAGTKVICLNQINSVQLALAKNFDHEFTVVLPEDGFPIDRPGVPRPELSYKICIKTLESVLEKAVS